MSVQVASQAAERLKTYDLRKLENFKKILGMLGFDGEILTFSLKTGKKTTAKYSIQKPFLLNFVNLFTTFYPGLYD